MIKFMRLLTGTALLLFANESLATESSSSRSFVLENCHVRVQDEAEIPAPEAGVLMNLPVREGSRVAEGDVLATIDDREARALLNIAEFGLLAAEERANDKVEETYARKVAEYAKVDWEKAVAANRQTPDSVSDMEIREKWLAVERSILQIKKAMKDKKLAGLDARTKEAERDAAKMQLGWRTVLAPFNGEIVSTKKHQAEWVQPGDTILHLVRFEKLYVEGIVDSKQFDRGDLLGRAVTVESPRTRGPDVKVSGKIVYTEQSLTHKGEYQVRAEVDNVLENENWLIQPGVKAKMTIHLDRLAPQPANSSTARRE